MNEQNSMSKSRAGALVLTVFAIIVAAPAQSQDLGKALAACASIAENEARLTCFDALAALLGDG